MLLNLHIKNMALIDDIEIDFSDNLNILTGETGAGKSIIIGSVMLALGGKTPKDFVRKDAPYGLVELLFLVQEEETRQRLIELDVPDMEEGQLILSRKIIGNRSVSKVNGETVTLSKIREISSLLLDLHAQHEHQSLLVPGNHLKLLDRYGQESLEEDKKQVYRYYREYITIQKELDANSMDDEEKKRKMDLLTFERDEIENAALTQGEDEQLEEDYHKAANSRNIAESLSNAYTLVEQEAESFVDRAIREMITISEYDEELSSMTDMLSTVSDLMGDFTREAREYLDEHIFSEEEFKRLEERLNLVNHLKAKYGKRISDILEYKNSLEQQIERLENQEAYLQQLRKQFAEAEKRLAEACKKLSTKRKQIAEMLCGQITEALVDLNFLDVRFDMVFTDLETYTGSGTDHAWFIISTNVGEEMKPLWQVASGGELSRIMLAIKSVLADTDRVETLIFDEIDVGISGRTAQMVAEKIHKISKNHQIICITHLPQIAAMANQHYLIEKQVIQDKTVTNIYPLEETQQIQELARLIGGVKITDTVLQSAKEMKELAVKAKVD